MVLFSPMDLWFMYCVLLTNFCLHISIVIHADAFPPQEGRQSDSTVNGQYKCRGLFDVILFLNMYLFHKCTVI